MSEEYKPLGKDEIQAFLEFLYICVRDAIEYMEPAEELYNLLIADIDYKGLFKQHVLPEEVLPRVQEFTRCSDDYIKLLHTTQKYRADMRHWEEYQRWLTNRNESRAAMERKCGYDSKHMMHCIRLLKMANHCLATGELIVDRREAGDVQELLTIRNGDVPYEEVSSRASELFNEMDALYKVSVLPKYVDRDRLNAICVEAVMRFGR